MTRASDSARVRPLVSTTLPAMKAKTPPPRRAKNKKVPCFPRPSSIAGKKLPEKKGVLTTRGAKICARANSLAEKERYAPETNASERHAWASHGDWEDLGSIHLHTPKAATLRSLTDKYITTCWNSIPWF